LVTHFIFPFFRSFLIVPTARVRNADSRYFQREQYPLSTTIMSLKAELETWAAALKAYDGQEFEKALDFFSVRLLPHVQLENLLIKKEWC